MLCVYAYAVEGVPLTIYTALKSFGISFHTLVARLRRRSVFLKKKAVCQQLEKHEMEHLFTFVLLMHSTK